MCLQKQTHYEHHTPITMWDTLFYSNDETNRVASLHYLKSYLSHIICENHSNLTSPLFLVNKPSSILQLRLFFLTMNFLFEYPRSIYYAKHMYNNLGATGNKIYYNESIDRKNNNGFNSSTHDTDDQLLSQPISPDYCLPSKSLNSQDKMTFQLYIDYLKDFIEKRFPWNMIEDIPNHLLVMDNIFLESLSPNLPLQFNTDNSIHQLEKELLTNHPLIHAPIELEQHVDISSDDQSRVCCNMVKKTRDTTKTAVLSDLENIISRSESHLSAHGDSSVVNNSLLDEKQIKQNIQNTNQSIEPSDKNNILSIKRLSGSYIMKLFSEIIPPSIYLRIHLLLTMTSLCVQFNFLTTCPLECFHFLQLLQQIIIKDIPKQEIHPHIMFTPLSNPIQSGETRMLSFIAAECLIEMNTNFPGILWHWLINNKSAIIDSEACPQSLNNHNQVIDGTTTHLIGQQLISSSFNNIMGCCNCNQNHFNLNNEFIHLNRFEQSCHCGAFKLIQKMSQIIKPCCFLKNDSSISIIISVLTFNIGPYSEAFIRLALNILSTFSTNIFDSQKDMNIQLSIHNTKNNIELTSTNDPAQIVYKTEIYSLLQDIGTRLLQSFPSCSSKVQVMLHLLAIKLKIKCPRYNVALGKLNCLHIYLLNTFTCPIDETTTNKSISELLHRLLLLSNDLLIPTGIRMCAIRLISDFIQFTMDLSSLSLLVINTLLERKQHLFPHLFFDTPDIIATKLEIIIQIQSISNRIEVNKQSESPHKLSLSVIFKNVLLHLKTLLYIQSNTNSFWTVADSSCEDTLHPMIFHFISWIPSQIFPSLNAYHSCKFCKHNFISTTVSEPSFPHSKITSTKKNRPHYRLDVNNSVVYETCLLTPLVLFRFFIEFAMKYPKIFLTADLPSFICDAYFHDPTLFPLLFDWLIRTAEIYKNSNHVSSSLNAVPVVLAQLIKTYSTCLATDTVHSVKYLPLFSIFCVFCPSQGIDVFLELCRYARRCCTTAPTVKKPILELNPQVILSCVLDAIKQFVFYCCCDQIQDNELLGNLPSDDPSMIWKFFISINCQMEKLLAGLKQLTSYGFPLTIQLAASQLIQFAVPRLLLALWNKKITDSSFSIFPPITTNYPTVFPLYVDNTINPSIVNKKFCQRIPQDMTKNQLTLFAFGLNKYSDNEISQLASPLPLPSNLLKSITGPPIPFLCLKKLNFLRCELLHIMDNCSSIFYDVFNKEKDVDACILQSTSSQTNSASTEDIHSILTYFNEVLSMKHTPSIHIPISISFKSSAFIKNESPNVNQSNLDSKQKNVFPTEIVTLNLQFCPNPNYKDIPLITAPYILTTYPNTDGTTRTDDYLGSSYEQLLSINVIHPIPCSISPFATCQDIQGQYYLGPLESFQLMFQDFFLPVCLPWRLRPLLFKTLQSYMRPSKEQSNLSPSRIENLYNPILNEFLDKWLKTEESINNDEGNETTPRANVFCTFCSVKVLDIAQSQCLQCIDAWLKPFRIEYDSTNSRSDPIDESYVPFDFDRTSYEPTPGLEPSGGDEDDEEETIEDRIFSFQRRGNKETMISSDSANNVDMKPDDFIWDESSSDDGLTKKSILQLFTKNTLLKKNVTEANDNIIRNIYHTEVIVKHFLIFLPPIHHIILKFRIGPIVSVVDVATSTMDLLEQLEDFLNQWIINSKTDPM